MKTLLIKDLTKKYKVGKDKYFTALKATNLAFESCGLVSIVGKSGSGKSTLINLISRIDTPTSGDIYLYGKPYSSFKKSSNSYFYNQQVGIVFQQYNLFDDYTVLTNVILPLQIAGRSRKESELIAKETLKKVGIKEELFNNLASELSGGERQRVSIARAIVNEPRILLCDEPTGALDSKNSVAIMELIKKISEGTLVLLVSHNLQLVEKFSDRIIEIADGQVIRDEMRKEPEIKSTSKAKKKKTGSSWISKVVSNNYKRRIGRNIFSIVSLSVSLTMMYLVFGFAYNKDTSVKEACYRQLDFGSGSVSVEKSTTGQGMLTLKKTERPSIEVLKGNLKIDEKYEICPNFSSILPSNLQISYQNEELHDLIFTPIYSFDHHINSDLLTMGRFPNNDDPNEVVVNEFAYNKIKEYLNKNPLNETLSFDQETNTTYVTELGEEIIDTFIFHQEMKIVGVVKEINYLPSQKIYYSYSSLIELMKESIAENISTYYDYDISWFDRVMKADDYSPISGYSYQLFLKDYLDKDYSFDKNIFTNDLIFTSQSILLAESLFNFLEVAEYGVILFLVITFVGSILILSIISLTSFSEDHKNSAILSSIGASDEQVQDVYVQESMFNGMISFVCSTLLAVGLSQAVNLVISKFIDLNNLIAIPFLNFMGIKFLLPLIVIVGIMFVILFSTLIPIYFSKKKSIKGELQSL